MSELFETIAARHVEDPSYHSLSRLAATVLVGELAVPAGLAAARDIRHFSYDQRESWSRKLNTFLHMWDPEFLVARQPANVARNYGRPIVAAALPVQVHGNTHLAAIPAIGRFQTQSLELHAIGGAKATLVTEIDLNKLRTVPVSSKDPELARHRLEDHLRQYQLADLILAETIEIAQQENPDF